MRSNFSERSDERLRPQDVLERYAILDFEASSLSARSWPIEVGLSWVAGDEVETWSSLIRPDETWDLQDWSPASAAVHGIALDQLAEAPDRAWVTQEFHRQLGKRQLVSDAPEFETRWLAQLIGLDPSQVGLRVQDFDAVSFARFKGYALDMVYETVERRTALHRAGPDTARLAAGWLAAMRAEGRDPQDAIPGPAPSSGDDA